MLARLTISLTPAESDALRRMVELDFRPPREQLRWLLRQEAQRRGLLPSCSENVTIRSAGANEPAAKEVIEC